MRRLKQLAPLLALACASEIDIKTVDPEEECILDPWCPDCGVGTCDVSFMLSEQALDCLWDEGNDEWYPTVPLDVQSTCSEPGASGFTSPCLVLAIEAFEMESNPVCCDRCQPDTPQACCSWYPDTEDPDYNMLRDAVQEFVDAQASGNPPDSDCVAVGLGDITSLSCDNRYEPVATWDEQCGEENYDCGVPLSSSLRMADYILYADVLTSYIFIDDGSSSLLAGVEGFGSAHVSPNAFLNGFFWVKNATLGTSTYTDWVLGFEHPIQFASSGGSFVIPVSEVDGALFRGEGGWDGDPAKVLVGMDHPATGQINSSTGTWSLDYTDSGVGWELDIHLSGAYEDVP